MSDENTVEQPDDERRWSRLLQSLNTDAAPPDASTLNAIRAGLRESVSGKTAPRVLHSRTTHESPRKERSMVLPSRIALAITILAGLFGLTSLLPQPAEAVTFRELLDEFQSAETLRFTLTRDGETADVWLRQPGELRWQESPTRYRIARGSRLWRIDEDANTVAAENSPWFSHAGRGIGLLPILGLPDVAAAELDARPTAETISYAGTRCQVYHLPIAARDRTYQLEAYAAIRSRRLLGLVVTDPAAPAGVPPVAEFRLTAVDAPIDESLFVVAESLSEDGRIGKILNAQGTVTLKPLTHRRWTPVSGPALIKPGDWLRTDTRGANAALMALTSPVRLTVGPASLVELISPQQVRLHRGEMSIEAAGELEEPFTVLGPGDAVIEVRDEGEQIVRLTRTKSLAVVEEAPQWLLGFQGSTSNESLGSLIINVDGRNEPLTVGYHHVSVEIRDQIARTTIEESFVNHTDGRLEGTFHFPLPQDASISGFGMWIGNELVEADVVEKQRAREIYETILREKRDPGLLEWTGGNIFKARVFPIEPHSEKQIKIVYTQVLPLRGNGYRYSYALDSELLRVTPLRDLSIAVTIHSALPLRSVECPSHTTRGQMAGHSASVEFDAQEYTPDRDFELVCTLDRGQQDVVVIPHRRGDDGYFLLQLMPPAAEGQFRREVLPDGEPLDLLLLLDTSGSMNSRKRQEQADFVAALLASLGENDRFRLACCDVDTVWGIEEPTEVTDGTRERALTFLDKRRSLGWTDLDQAFEAVADKVGEGTDVIYVGDGIVSTGDADPAAFVNRLRAIFRKHGAGRLHAVTVGSSYESIALRGIASIGGGSMRAINNETGPEATAFELLNELAQPGLTDVELEFRGVDVAAVYPERLPNIAAGTQQIVVGRYLPRGEDQQGEVIVTGKLGGEQVRYAAQIALAGAEHGNSFIPRLWARGHLDNLLQQGSSQFIQDEIIALSEEYHIITPYTSLLVLESDEDRERFGVKRRFGMRDGEDFFAKGRDEAQYELKKQQMQQAGTWRIGLRRQVLAELSRLGRDPNVFGGLVGSNKERGINRGRLLEVLERTKSEDASRLGRLGPANLGFETLGDFEALQAFPEQAEVDFEGFSTDGKMLALANSPVDVSLWDTSLQEMTFRQSSFELGMPLFSLDGERKALADLSLATRGGRFVAPKRRARVPIVNGVWMPETEQTAMTWVAAAFPTLADPPDDERPIRSGWPDNVRAVTDPLVQLPRLTQIDGGLAITIVHEHRDPRWDRVTSRSEKLELYSPQTWLSRPTTVGSDIEVDWCDAERRGVYSATFGLGRTRKADPRDLARHVVGADLYAQQPLHEALPETTAELNSVEPGRAIVVLRYLDAPSYAMRIHIDTDRHIVLSFESLNDGKTTETVMFSDHVEAHGLWWPTRITTRDADGEVTEVVTQSVTALTADEFQERYDSQLAGDPDDVVVSRDDALVIEDPLPDLEQAKQAVADGSADFTAQLVVLAHYATSEQWDEVRGRLEAIEKLAGDRPGVPWLQAPIWKNTREHETLRQMLLALAGNLAENQRPDEYAVAERIRDTAYSITDWNEYAELLQILRPVYERQPAVRGAKLVWQRYWLQTLQRLGRDARELAKQMAVENPWDVGLQTQFARTTAAAGDRDAATAWIDTQLAREVPLDDYERAILYDAYFDLLYEPGEFARLVNIIEDWMSHEPESSDPYARYLSGLVFVDRTERAEELVREWVAAARHDGPLAGTERARLDAAVSFMLGQIYQLRSSNMDPQWLPLLQETAAFHLRRDGSFEVARRIIDTGGFRDSDACDALLRETLDYVTAEAAALRPDHLSALIGWLLSGSIEVRGEDVAPIAQTLRARWSEETDADKQYELGQALLSIYGNRLGGERLLFLRAQAADGLPEHRASYVQALFDAVLAGSWTDEHEIEAFDLLPRLGTSFVPEDVDEAAQQQALAQQLVHQITALYRLVDRLVEARTQAAWTEFQDTGHPEELTRAEVAARQAEYLEAARTGVRDRLRSMAAVWSEAAEAADEGAPERTLLASLGGWADLEALTIEVQLGRDLDVAANTCWRILDETSADAPASENPVAEVLASLAELRRDRALVTLMNLAARRSATPELADRVLAYLDRDEDDEDVSRALRQSIFALLVALDRPDESERRLRDWITDDAFTAPWRVYLAKLRAERGDLPEAIALLEAVQDRDEVSPEVIALLADWYHAVDRREDYERSRREVFATTDDYYLQQFVRSHIHRWESAGGPRGSSVDDEALFALRALFEKAPEPGNYLWHAASLYRASRDHRVLRMLPDSLIGRTPQQVYSFLGNMSSVLACIEREATSDEILDRLVELRTNGTVASAIDLRALDLFEALVERRAAKVLNQPGPHAAAALAALRRAFDREWAPGEPRQMSHLLAEWGHITDGELAAEQIRQLRVLAAENPAETDDGLSIHYDLCRTLFDAYQRHEDAIAEMGIAVRTYAQQHPEGWPPNANKPLDNYSGFLEQRAQYTTAESLLDRHIGAPLNAGQKQWMQDRLDDLYLHALAHHGRVSLGEEQTLFANLQRRLIDRCAAANSHRQVTLVARLMDVFRTARKVNLAGVQDDLTAFAFETLPELLPPRNDDYVEVLERVSDTLHELISAREGLRFLIVRLESYPQRMQRTNEDPWRRFGDRIASWRWEVRAQLGDLEQPLLRLVLSELRRDLLEWNERNRALYHDDYRNRFWSEHADDFLRVAEEVYTEQRNSMRSVTYIAHYLHEGLAQTDRAIEMLFVAERDGILDDDGRGQLVDFLFYASRFAEAAPLLEGMVANAPDVMSHRARLMRAYHHGLRHQQVEETRAAADEHFRQSGRWVEGNIAELASACFDCDLMQHAVDYYNEVIPLRQRSVAGGGVDDQTTSHYYQQLARAYSRLGRTEEAVEAASSAIVAWSRSRGERQDALKTLNHVLTKAADLDAYVASFDERAAQSGQDSPILRRAIGHRYLELEHHAEAARHLEIALELQPGEPDTYTDLLKCYDAMNQAGKAFDLVLAQIDLNPHDLELYGQLDQHTGDDPALRERAATSVVEAAPLEASHHQALADLRARQERWRDAADQWQRVAELRALEPNGLLGLADVQIKSGDTSGARRTIRLLESTEWPSRFGELVDGRLDELKKQLP